MQCPHGAILGTWLILRMLLLCSKENLHIKIRQRENASKPISHRCYLIRQSAKPKNANPIISHATHNISVYGKVTWPKGADSVFTQPLDFRRAYAMQFDMRRQLCSPQIMASTEPGIEHHTLWHTLQRPPSHPRCTNCVPPVPSI